MPKIGQHIFNDNDVDMQRNRQMYHPYALCKENIIEKFKELHNMEISKVEAMQRQANKQTIESQKIILDQSKIISNLQVMIDEKQKQLEALTIELDAMQQQKEWVYMENTRLSRKYTNLELKYDEELKKFDEMTEKYNDLQEEFTTYRQQQEALIANYKMKESELNITAENEKLHNDHNADQQQYENQIEILKQSYEQELEGLKIKLEEKDELIANCQEEKTNIEKEKNNIIDELTYNLRRIENVKYPLRQCSPIVGPANLRSFILQKHTSSYTRQQQLLNKNTNYNGSIKRSSNATETIETHVSLNVLRSHVSVTNSKNNYNNNLQDQKQQPPQQDTVFVKPKDKAPTAAATLSLKRNKRIRLSSPKRFAVELDDFTIDDSDSKPLTSLQKNDAKKICIRRLTSDKESVSPSSTMDPFDRLKNI